MINQEIWQNLLQSNRFPINQIISKFRFLFTLHRYDGGIKKAKEKGVSKGRKQTVDVAKIKELASEGLMKTEIAKRLGIGRATDYRALGD